MSTRREEERNEKIIRGLMKLPPNRRCINCNALGPQYVCTTFWTFVCMTCSGIHREFTHRVKSVSMSKFTSQEVEALQKGGNQRAREMYLNSWDLDGHRLPNNSNPIKVRAFIKTVYVDKKYVGWRSSDKPPRDSQNPSNHEEETRRASSYHSYSQSPPYDFQYEERRYGKRALALTRKLGSDRGLYEGKFSSFLSPSRLSDHSYDDRLSNEGSNPRISDYSVSSRGDPLRPNGQSPNLQKEIGSPFSETSRDVSVEDVQHYIGKDGVKVLRPQRTMSSGSFGSFDGNSRSFKSVSSTGLVEIDSEAELSSEAQTKELSTVSSLPHPPISGSSDALDLFSATFAPQDVTSVASESNTSQFPELKSTPSLDLFQPPSSTTPTFSACQLAQSPTTASSGLFSTGTVNDGGWATFDSHNDKQAGVETVAVLPSHGNSVRKVDPLSLASWSSFEDSAAPSVPSSSPSLWQEGSPTNLSTFNASSTQWSSFPDFSANAPSRSIPAVWNESQLTVEASSSRIDTQSWNAFEDSSGNPPTQSTQTSSEQVEVQHPAVTDFHLEFGVFKDSSSNGVERAAADPGLSYSGISHISTPLEDFSKPVMAAGHPFESDHKSTNPFDLPYEPDAESNNMFWDMSSLQAALPNGETPVPFSGGVTHPWFSPGPVPPYAPTGPQDALGLIARQAPSSQIPNMQTQGGVATIGGNPFA